MTIMKKVKLIKFQYVCFLFSFIVLFNQSSIGQEKSENNHNENKKPRLIESYSEFKSDEASSIIDLLRKEVSFMPNSKGFIIVYCGKVCQYGEIEAHLRGIVLALRFKGVNSNQFVAIAGGFREKTVAEFWLVPEGSYPDINSSIDFKDIKFKGIYKKKIVDYECCF